MELDLFYLHVDIENPQMLWCIICTIEQASANDLCQQPILQKGLIKFNKLNGILPMTHIEYAHPRLVAQRKLVIAKKTTKTNHSQQSRKKLSRPIGCAITTLFGAKNVSKKCDEAR